LLNAFPIAELRLVERVEQAVVINVAAATGVNAAHRIHGHFANGCR